MKRFLLFAILMLIAPSLVLADWVVREDGVEVLLSKKACTNEAILKLAAPQVQKMLYAATVTYGGKSLHVCWVPFQDQAAVVFEDGDVIPIPASTLTQLKEI